MTPELTTLIAIGMFVVAVVALFVAVLRVSTSLASQIGENTATAAGLRRDLDRQDVRIGELWRAHDATLSLVTENARHIAVLAAHGK